MTFDGRKVRRASDSTKAANTTIATPPVPGNEGCKELKCIMNMSCVSTKYTYISLSVNIKEMYIDECKNKLEYTYEQIIIIVC